MKIAEILRLILSPVELINAIWNLIKLIFLPFINVFENILKFAKIDSLYTLILKIFTNIFQFIDFIFLSFFKIISAIWDSIMTIPILRSILFPVDIIFRFIGNLILYIYTLIKQLIIYILLAFKWILDSIGNIFNIFLDLPLFLKLHFPALLHIFQNILFGISKFFGFIPFVILTVLNLIGWFLKSIFSIFTMFKIPHFEIPDFLHLKIPDNVLSILGFPFKFISFILLSLLKILSFSTSWIINPCNFLGNLKYIILSPFYLVFYFFDFVGYCLLSFWKFLISLLSLKAFWRLAHWWDHVCD